MLIRVIDLETTGTTAEDAVCEIGWCDLDHRDFTLGGKPYDWVVRGNGHALVNPGRPIPPEVSAIHHIIDEDVADAEPWNLAVQLFTESHRASGYPEVLAAHSAKFERQFITDDQTEGLPWICTYKCALRLWPDAPSHSNQALRYWRKPAGLDRTIASVAHRALPDAYVTAFLLRDMLNDSDASVEDLIQWSSEPALQVRCHIGKWRGTPWCEVDTGFLHFDQYASEAQNYHITLETADALAEACVRLSRSRDAMRGAT